MGISALPCIVTPFLKDQTHVLYHILRRVALRGDCALTRPRIFWYNCGVLTKDEKDALFARMLRPYSDAEFGLFVRSPEWRLREKIERVHYHNQGLCNLVEDWRDYRSGRAPKPSESLLLALTPGRGGANDARDTLGFIADFYASRPHGSVERWPCLAYMSMSSMTLIDRIAMLHPTDYLSSARKHFREFMALIAYEGEPSFVQDEYAARVHSAASSFFDDCERNAVEIDLWLHDKPSRCEATASAANGSG